LGVDGEKSFLAVIERTPGAMIAPRQIEVVNLGRPSADVADYERVERDLALPLKPDLIFLTFFYGRDSVVDLPDAWGMTSDSAIRGESLCREQAASARHSGPPGREEAGGAAPAELTFTSKVAADALRKLHPWPALRLDSKESRQWRASSSTASACR
jgi:hypothetical protein